MQKLQSRANNKLMRALPQTLSHASSRIRVKAGDNWLLVGRKGSGKTTFGKILLNNLIKLYPTSRVYILDVKRRDFNDYEGITETDYEAPELPDSNQRFQIWQPLIEVPDEIEKWLYMVRKDAPCILDIDELLALCYKRNQTSDEFKIIQKLGRDLPIATLSGTQELVQIPRNAIGQADHYVKFRLKHPYEKTIMKQIIGETDDPLDPYGFHYAHANDQGSPQYFKDHSSFF